MDILEKIIYILVVMVFLKVFTLAESKADNKHTSKVIVYLSRTLIILVYTIAITSLFAYSILITEVSPIIRLVAGVLAILLLLYFIKIIKRYMDK